MVYYITLHTIILHTIILWFSRAGETILRRRRVSNSWLTTDERSQQGQVRRYSITCIDMCICIQCITRSALRIASRMKCVLMSSRHQLSMAAVGDGLQITYGMIYHVIYGDTYTYIYIYMYMYIRREREIMLYNY